MMEKMIYQYKNQSPKIHPTCFIADNATIIGDVTIGEQSSIWYNVVIRGDVNHIVIESNTNIQDGSILHVTHDEYPLYIGPYVTVGHGTILHGCKIESNCLIGMGAVIMDGAVVGSDSIIGARALVTPGMKIPSNTLVIGSPAKIKRPVTNEEMKMIQEHAKNYQVYAQSYFKDLRVL